MSRKLLVGSLALGAGALVLALQLGPKRQYAYGVADFLARDVREREVKVSGLLVYGSLCRVDAECGYRFAMADERQTVEPPALTAGLPSILSVRYDGCFLPDNFRSIPGLDVSVTVQGERCQTCHHFQASQLLTRGAGKYEMPTNGSAPHRVPQRPSAPPLPRCDALSPRM